jgi:hypothetical protein
MRGCCRGPVLSRTACMTALGAVADRLHKGRAPAAGMTYLPAPRGIGGVGVGGMLGPVATRPARGGRVVEAACSSECSRWRPRALTHLRPSVKEQRA